MTKTSTRKPCRGVTRAGKAARWSTILGLATLFASPAPAQYVWSLGDLADVSSRLNVDWDTGAWADPYDTEEELLARGWTTVNIRASSCSADTTDPRDEDEATVRSQIAAQCPGGNCGNKIMKFASNCTYDFIAGGGNVASTPGGLDLPYSNVAYIGGGMNSTYLHCNDSSNETTSTAACIGTSDVYQRWPGNDTTETGPAFPWLSGNTRGTTVITVTAAPAQCATLVAQDRVLLKGLGSDGLNLWSFHEVVSSEALGSNVCRVNIADALKYDIPTRTEIVKTYVQQTRNTFFIGLTIGFPNFPDGAARDATGTGNLVTFNHPTNLMFNGVRLGPYANTVFSTVAHLRLSIRNSEIGPGQFSKRRGTNGRVFHFGKSGRGGSFSLFNNVFTDGAKRFIELSQMSTNGSWTGFNYQTDMLATRPGETGSHWNGVRNPQGIAHSTVCGGCGTEWERTIYWSHDSNATSKPGLFLIEANDMGGHQFSQGIAGDFNRYTTLYRNRQDRSSLCGITCGSPLGNEGPGSIHHYVNWFANRFVSWAPDATRNRSALGRWNVGESSAPAITAAGATWPTSSTYKNYVDAGPHDDYTTTRIPPSLALKQDSAPSWWCQESGPWDGTWSFAYGDGADSGGVPRKLPAQIRYEGGTCTPPSGTAISLPAPVLFE